MVRVEPWGTFDRMTRVGMTAPLKSDSHCTMSSRDDDTASAVRSRRPVSGSTHVSSSADHTLPTRSHTARGDSAARPVPFCTICSRASASPAAWLASSGSSSTVMRCVRMPSVLLPPIWLPSAPSAGAPLAPLENCTEPPSASSRLVDENDSFLGTATVTLGAAVGKGVGCAVGCGVGAVHGRVGSVRSATSAMSTNVGGSSVCGPSGHRTSSARPATADAPSSPAARKTRLTLSTPVASAGSVYVRAPASSSLSRARTMVATLASGRLRTRSLP
mmetsp:Transcript_10509/g.33282  ORF Transcript_10509/g.33282 Transcript_10509/m.33282 type:complete len:275 (+) Transcript_10509:1094-1918(+)